MTVERRFSEPVTRYAPPRRRVRQMVLLFLAALVCWLLSGCEMHGEALDWESWRAGVVTGLAGSATALVLWIVALKVRRDDEEAQIRWSAESQRPAEAGTALPGEDPLAGAWQGVDRAEVGRILGAVIAEVGEVGDIVGRARGNLSVEDYGQGLTAAEHRLRGVGLCLGKLSDEFPVPVVKPVEVSLSMDVERFSAALRKARGSVMRFKVMVDDRLKWVRAYHSPASAYGPAHGGYAQP